MVDRVLSISVVNRIQELNQKDEKGNQKILKIIDGFSDFCFQISSFDSQKPK